MSVVLRTSHAGGVFVGVLLLLLLVLVCVCVCVCIVMFCLYTPNYSDRDPLGVPTKRSNMVDQALVFIISGTLANSIVDWHT